MSAVFLLLLNGQEYLVLWVMARECAVVRLSVSLLNVVGVFPSTTRMATLGVFMRRGYFSVKTFPMCLLVNGTHVD